MEKIQGVTNLYKIKLEVFRVVSIPFEFLYLDFLIFFLETIPKQAHTSRTNTV